MEERNEFDFVKFLKKGKEQEDKNIFSDWEAGAITTETALRRFRKNNGITNDCEIKELEFRFWLFSLGYRR